jgi:hypothetical protein
MQIPLCTPFCAGDVTESRGNQHQCRFAIWKSPHDPRSAPYLTHQPLQRIICPQGSPVLTWKIIIAQLDPLLCPKCQGIMKIISFIEEPDIIRKILVHLDLWDVRNMIRRLKNVIMYTS